MTEFEKWLISTWIPENDIRSESEVTSRELKRMSQAWNGAIGEFISSASWAHEWDKLHQLAEGLKYESTTVKNEETERDHSEVEG